ncbi:hypothetical protein DFH28DRAFT_1166508 [Melampsora americana]|nr:hypothetical protein DFH28DRAFT_1166508 [Melampsora americana]
MPPRRLTLRPHEFPFEGSQDSGSPLKLVMTRHGTKVSKPSRIDEFGNNSLQHLGNQSSSRHGREDDKLPPPAWLERALEIPDHGQTRTSDAPPSSRRYPSFHRPVPRQASRHPQQHHRSLATIDSTASLASRRIESHDYGSASASIDRVRSPRVSPQMLPPYLVYPDHPLTYPNEPLHEHNSPTPVLASDGIGWGIDQAPEHLQSSLSLKTLSEGQSRQGLQYDLFPSHSSPLLNVERWKTMPEGFHERQWQRRSSIEPTPLYTHLPLSQQPCQPLHSPSHSLQSHKAFPSKPEPDRYLLKLASAAEAIASSEAGYSSPLGRTLPLHREDTYFQFGSPKHGAFNTSPTRPRARSSTSPQSDYLMYPRTTQYLDNEEVFRHFSHETAHSDDMALAKSEASHQQQALEDYETFSPTHTTWSNQKDSPSLNVWKKRPQILSDIMKYETQSKENTYEDQISDPDIFSQPKANLTNLSEIIVSKKPSDEERDPSRSSTFFIAEEDKAVFAELRALTRLGTTSMDRPNTISPDQVRSACTSVTKTEEIQQEVEVEQAEDWSGLERLLEEYPESNVDFDEDGSGPGFVIWQDPDIS